MLFCIANYFRDENMLVVESAALGVSVRIGYRGYDIFNYLNSETEIAVVVY